jgi:hypothetical protein
MALSLRTFLKPRLDKAFLGVFVGKASGPSYIKNKIPDLQGDFFAQLHCLFVVQQFVAQDAKRQISGFSILLLDLGPQLLPASSHLSKDFLGVYLGAECDADLLARAREESRELATLVHDIVKPLDPHRHHIRALVRLENESRNAPFEVTHGLAWCLVDLALGEDVNPRV